MLQTSIMNSQRESYACTFHPSPSPSCPYHSGTGRFNALSKSDISKVGRGSERRRTGMEEGVKDDRLCIKLSYFHSHVQSWWAADYILTWDLLSGICPYICMQNTQGGMSEIQTCWEIEFEIRTERESECVRF